MASLCAYVTHDALCPTAPLQAGYIVGESVHGIRTVAAFDLGNSLNHLYGTRLVEPKKQGIRGGHCAGFGYGFSQAIMFAVYAFAFYIGAIWVDDGDLTFDDFMKVLMAVMMT